VAGSKYFKIPTSECLFNKNTNDIDVNVLILLHNILLSSTIIHIFSMKEGGKEEKHTRKTLTN